MALAPISQDANQVTKKLGLSTDLMMIDHAWSLEIGSLRDAVRIVAIDQGSLVVETDSHAVMQELSLRRKELLRKLNHHLPEPRLNHLTVRIAQYHGR